MVGTKPNIAILIPVCSRKQNYQKFEDTSLYSRVIPFLSKTTEDKYNYYLFIGVDDDDEFYLSIIQQMIQAFSKINITSSIVRLNGFQHAPAKAWGALAKIAYKTKEVFFDYFFQVGDDVEILNKNWTSRFIGKLQQHNNLGVVGPINLTNYNERREKNISRVIENSFVHRTHIDIFNTYFNDEIKNWFCDNWITSIYRNSNSLCFIDKEVICTNTIRDVRYDIKILDIQDLIVNGVKRIVYYKKNLRIPDYTPTKKETMINGKKVFSYCLYGGDKKYCLGMLKNIEQINQFYPDFYIYVHCGNDVPEEYLNKMRQDYTKVNIINYDFTGVELMTYRFFSVDDDDIDLLILRDADSRITDRCRWVIDDFISSSYNVFTIRDHKYHTSKLMAGQSGFKFIKPELKNVYEKEWKKKSAKYWDDKHFLNFAIHDRFFEEFLVYSDIVIKEGENNRKIGLERKDEHDFCGNVVLFDGDNNEYLEY